MFGLFRAEIETKREFLQEMSRNIANQSADADKVRMGVIIGLLAFGTLILFIIIYSYRRYLFGRLVVLRKFITGQVVARARYKAHVEIILDAPLEKERVLRTTIENLSDGGMFVKMNPPLKRSELFRFRLLLSDTERIEGSAEVMWVQNRWSEHHSSGVGCKFHQISDQARNLIRLWIRRNKPSRVS